VPACGEPASERAASAQAAAPVAQPSPAPSRPSVLLLGLDGADWDVMTPLIESGHLPHLGRLATEGARGDLDCVPAMPETACFCPPVWVTIATGVPFERHRISLIHHTSRQRRARPVWSLLHDAGGSSTLVSYRNTWPPEPSARYVFTEYGLDWASRFYFDRSGDEPGRTQSRERPDGKHVAPADLLEQLGLLPYEGPKTPALAMLARDRIAMEALLRLAPRDRTDLTVVLLHGPDKVEHLLWKQAQRSKAVPFDADVVRAQAEAFAGPPPRLGRGPKMTLASPYLEIDAWLGELLAAAHYDYVVLASDHGMAPNEGEAGLAGGHSKNDPEAHQGVFAIHGPGIAAGTVLQGATVLDVAPTVAYLLNLPRATDQPGELLESAFTPAHLASRPPRTVPTWQPR
jgi:predicted AlkP superfamily phosphohydrolase/phosphomutase